MVPAMGCKSDSARQLRLETTSTYDFDFGALREHTRLPAEELIGFCQEGYLNNFNRGDTARVGRDLPNIRSLVELNLRHASSNPETSPRQECKTCTQSSNCL